MEVILSKFLFFTHFLVHYSRSTELCRESQGPVKNNEVLIEHGYKSMLTRGIFGCGHACLADLRCTSYNYQTSGVSLGACELNEGNIDGKEYFVKKRGFVNVLMKRKTRPKSCWEAWKQGARTSGFYVIQGRSECLLYEMFCDFSSEPGWAWTLIMSQSLGSRDEVFAKDPFLRGTFKNQRDPNWESYRIGKSRMRIVQAQSSHWRVTCDFATHGVDFRDYVRATFERLDPLKYKANGECREMEYMNIRGHNCTKCKAAWWQANNQFLTHFSDKDGCQFGKTHGFLDNEANFGGYWKNNASAEFRCSSTTMSSTNHWFGSKV